MAERKTESVIVAIAIDEVDETSALLMIGKRVSNDIEIINIVQGKEAMLLYEKLTIPSKTESVIVAIDIDELDETSALLVIGKRGFNDVEIINIIQGKEAISLYEKLTRPTKETSYVKY